MLEEADGSVSLNSWFGIHKVGYCKMALVEGLEDFSISFRIEKHRIADWITDFKIRS